MNKKNIWILFDCPDETNDKKWLLEELQKKHDGGVYSVSIHKTLHKLLRGNVVKKIYSHVIILWQCVRALIRSAEDDVFITWNHRNGLYLNAMLLFFRRKNRIITMNWLTPSPQILKNKRLIKSVFANPNARIVVNSPESVFEWNSCMGLERSCISVIPDVYDNDTVFRKRSSWKKYCFTGGVNNRDWNMVRKMSEHFPEINFICAARKKDFEEVVGNAIIPANMIVCYDIASSEYYELMQNAFVVLLPLRDKRVAGLINILRSASMGVPCMITKTFATSQYYSHESLLLIKDDDFLSWEVSLKNLLKMEKKLYQELSAEFCEYVKTNFSPYMASEKIYRLAIA